MRDYRDRIVDEAAEWFARLQDSEAALEERAAFTEWLSASPEHVKEYLLLTALRTDLSEQQSAEGVGQLIERAKPASEANVIAGVFASAAAGSDAPRERRGPIFWGALAASVLLITVVSVWWLHPDANAATYTTSVGEQKSFPLPDGSLVTLNAVSKLKLRFTEQYRDIQLSTGEALFSVAKNPARPFRVLTGDSVIQAVGTRFNVYHRQSSTTVTVVEGTVDVKKTAESAASVRLTKDERALVRPHEAKITVAKTHAAADIAWRERRLVFESRPLAEVVAEFNLYNKELIEIGDRKLDGLEISGSFYANDPHSFVLFLQEAALAEPNIAHGEITLWPIAR
jgi:transmembrane sensor